MPRCAASTAPPRARWSSSPSLERILAGHGFRNLMRWSRGVDGTPVPAPDGECAGRSAAPIFLFVGRLAVEKNIEAFLKLDLPGSKVVSATGLCRRALRPPIPRRISSARAAAKALAEIYSSADVFVFPSRTDTFGIVLLEALASGVPVAAFPVTGPLDVIGDSGTGVLSHDLREAALARARHLARTLPQICGEVHLEGKRAAVLRQYQRGAEPGCADQTRRSRRARLSRRLTSLSDFQRGGEIAKFWLARLRHRGVAPSIPRVPADRSAL